jgi:hypothetical protein
MITSSWVPSIADAVEDNDVTLIELRVSLGVLMSIIVIRLF